MARPGPQTQAKRDREQKKRAKRLAKKEKMELRRALKKAGTDEPVANLEGEPEQPEAEPEQDDAPPTS